MCAKCKEQILVEELFEEFYQSIEQAELTGVGAISIGLDTESGDLTLTEESDTVSVSKPIYAWVASDTVSAAEIEKSAILLITRALRELEYDGYFERPLYGRPLTVCYYDANGSDPNEVFFIDEEWSVDAPSLLEGIDRELDDFLERLMRE